MKQQRLMQQLRFVYEIDRLKSVLRRTRLADDSRQENTAEHSWHLAVMALVLAEHADVPELDLCHVVSLLLVHDIVEVDAGDTFCYDEQAMAGKLEREHRAAERLFGLLPADQAAQLRELWEEFEARSTPEARFAAALDRMQPILLNVATEGHAWRVNSVAKQQVLDRNRHIGEASQLLWEHVEQLIDEAAAEGWLR